MPVCALTARALRDLAHTALLDQMVAELGCPEPTAEALGDYGDARAVVPLIDAIKCRDPEVRCAAARGLGQLGDDRAPPTWLHLRKTTAESFGTPPERR